MFLCFQVEPIDLRIDDKAALLGRNFELSGWLLDLFMSHFPNLFQYSYITELYNAVVWYVINSRPSTKSRGVEILVRLLFHLRTLIQKEQLAKAGSKAPVAAQVDAPVTTKGSALTKLADLKNAPTVAPAATSLSLVPTSSAASSSFVYTLSHLPDFSKLAPLAQQMDAVLEGMGLSNAPPLHGHGGRQNYQRSLQSPTMMSTVELLSTVDLLSNEFELYQAAKKGEDTAAMSEVVKKPVEKQPKDTTILGLTPPGSENAIDLIEQFHDRLRVDKALLIFHVPPQDKSSAAARAPKDVTGDMIKYLGWSNNIQLFIPTDPAALKEMPWTEGEVSASALAVAGGSSSSASNKKAGYHKLQLTYSIITPLYNSTTQQLESKVSKTLSKSISLLAHSKPTLIKPQSSRRQHVTPDTRDEEGDGQGGDAGCHRCCGVDAAAFAE
jgi:hypothetical protein